MSTWEKETYVTTVCGTDIIVVAGDVRVNAASRVVAGIGSAWISIITVDTSVGATERLKRSNFVMLSFFSIQILKEFGLKRRTTSRNLHLSYHPLAGLHPGV